MKKYNVTYKDYFNSSGRWIDETPSQEDEMTEGKSKHDHEFQAKREEERNALRGSAKQIVKRERKRQRARKRAS